MRKVITMKNQIYTFTILIIISLFTVSCKNPLLGLGPAADIETPSGSINSYENGDYVRGSIILDGISDDDVKIESIRIVLNTEIFDADLTPGEETNWSIPIDTTEYEDGEYTIILFITDSSGRETEKRLLLYFDNTAPSVIVTSATGITSGAATNSPVIRGEAYDYLFSRIDRMEASVVSGDAEISSFQGTNGWNLTLQTTGTGNYSVKITAYDSAGNSNDWLYHISDFPTNTKIEDIANSEDIGKLGTLTLTPLRKISQDIEIDLSLDEPRVVISNPEEGKTAAQNVLGGSSVAVGYIEDDDEVDIAAIYLSLDGGSSWEALSGAQLSGSEGFIRWNYDLSALNNGIYNLQVKANDTGKPAGDISLTGYSPTVPFTIDKTAPSVSITSPEQGVYLASGDFTISGDAEDVGGTIQTVRISVNSGVYQDISITPGESVSWSHNLTGTAPGAVSLKVEAVDDSGKTSTYNQQVYVDVTDPLVNFLSPSAGLFINGTALLQGVSSDNWSLKQVKLQIGGLSWSSASAEALPPAEFYSWQRNIVTSEYENTGMAVEVNGSGTPQLGTGIWRLKIWAQAVDKADNTTLVEHQIYIDNSLDRPGINIASPSDSSVLAGSVMLSGSAWDDKNEVGEGLDHIEVRIWKGQDAGGGTSSFSELFDLNNLMGLDDVYGDDSWYKVNGTSTWQTELNIGGEFYPNGTDHNGTVKIDVRAVDQKSGVPDVAGNIESIQVTFDDTVPYFSDLSHTSGSYARGTFNLTGDVNDDDSVERLRISYDGGVNWTVIGTDIGASSSFSYSIDSNSIIGSSGILYLRLEALDTANYKTLVGINLNIDNLNPTGSYTGSLTDLSGTAMVQGTAIDTGAVSGVDRIEVSFTLDGTPINPLNSKGFRTPITIDSRTEAGVDGSSNGDDDGYNESMSISGSTWTWWAEFDTTSIDDGVLEVIYTIFDYAENTLSTTITGGNIKNHAPEINFIEAGWDYDHDGSIELGELKNYTVDTTENNAVFGDLSYSFNTSYDGDNGALDYSIRVRPLPAGLWTDVAAAASSGTLDTTLAAVFTGDDGDYEIEFSVEDTKGYQSLLTLGITVENSDTEDPVMDFHELTSVEAGTVKTDNSGHIEIDGTIYLSGSIPFEGRAEDNQRIESIAVSINSATAVPFVEWDDDADRLEYIPSGLPLETGSGFIEEGGNLLHRAEWKYEWDSATLPTGLGTTLAFIVTDAAGRTHSQTHTYDVVPYISSIDTMLSASYSDSLARSAKGRYPVLIENAELTFETVTVNGWNIDSPAAGSTSVLLSSDIDALASTTELAFTGAGDGSGVISVDLDADGSGYLTVIVDDVLSRNNFNSDVKTYNFEDSAVHQSLSDDRYMSIWDVTRLWRDITLADHAQYPTMTMSGNTPHFTYVNNSEGFGQALYYNGSSHSHINKNWDLFTYTALDFNDSGNHGALVDVNVVHGSRGDNNAGNYGGIYLNFFYDTPSHVDQNLDFLDYGLWLENLVDTTSPYTVAVLNRYQYPDIKMRGTTSSTNVFYSVYDTLENQLVFRHFLVGTDDSIDDSSGGDLTNTTTHLYTNVDQQNRSGSWPNYSGDDRFAYAGSAQPGATPPGAQEIPASTTVFSAVGATTDGRTAVLAYYDTTGSGSLVFRYNTSTTTAPDVPSFNDAGWSSPIVIDEFVDAKYIDLKVDASNHIHLAYYDSYHGNVKYAYIPAYNSSADTDYSDDATDTDVDLYTVDSYLIVGSKLTLDINSVTGDVYLAYKGLGDSMRAAWLTGTDGHGAISDIFTGIWEVQTVPNLVADSDSNRFNAGVDSNGQPVIGYTNDGLEYIRLLPELSE